MASTTRPRNTKTQAGRCAACGDTRKLAAKGLCWICYNQQRRNTRRGYPQKLAREHAAKDLEEYFRSDESQ